MRKRDPFAPRRTVGILEEEWTPAQDRDVNKLPLGRIAGKAMVDGAPNGLRLRESPVDGATLTTMPNGAVVGLGPSNTPGWGFVEYNGFYGYASTDYLMPVGGDPWDPKPIPEPQPTPPAPLPPSPDPAPPPPPPVKKTNLTVVVAGAAAGAALVLYLYKRWH